METTEKPLSEKEIKNLLSEKHPLFLKEDVVEAVDRLKEELDNIWKDVTDTYVDSGTISKIHKLWLKGKIDEIFGDLK